PVGITTLMLAVAVGLALGAGVVLGEYLAQPVRTSLGRLERRIAGPRMSGPLRPTKRRLECGASLPPAPLFELTTTEVHPPGRFASLATGVDNGREEYR